MSRGCSVRSSRLGRSDLLAKLQAGHRRGSTLDDLAVRAYRRKAGGIDTGEPVKAAAAIAAAALVLAGCSSSGGGTMAPATLKPAVTSGIETIAGQVTGTAAVAGNPAFRLTFRGPVNTTATAVLGSSPKKGQHRVFATGAGNLAVVVSGTATTVPMLLSAAACRYSFTTIVSYTVDGQMSTGKFAGAAGHGTVTVTEQADDPKLATGECNEASDAPPVAGTVTGTLTGGGPLTVKK